MKPLKPSIALPCHESWVGMTPNGNGRHCAACALTVVDFTGMKADEIAHYLMTQNGKRVCGRFENRQLASLRVTIPSAVLNRRRSFRKAFLLALFVTMGTTLFSCADEYGEKQRIDNIVVEDTVADEEVHMTTGVALPDEERKAPRVTVYEDSITVSGQRP